MSHRDPDPIDTEIREIFAQLDIGQHPSSEELTAYARGELPEAEAQRLQHHLGPCRECTATVLSLQSPRRETPADHLSDAEVTAEVERIVARASQSGIPPAESPSSWTRPSRGRLSPGSRSRALLAAAAGLAIACLSLSFFTLKLKQEVGELEVALQLAREQPGLPDISSLPPQTDIPIVDLFPSSVARGEAADAKPIPLGADTTMATLILTPPSSPSYDAHRLQILDQAGDELWRGPAQRDPAGVFVLMLPRRFAEAGADRVVLYGIEDESATPLATYPLRFEL